MDFIKNEHEVLAGWAKNNIFAKRRAQNQGKTPWSFLDGPITANNPMGVHHAWGRTLKDFFQRVKAMQGFDQRYQNGFDCQGLWVEVEVEKELGFNSKHDIEAYGLDKFSEACAARVKKYAAIQTEQSQRLGQWMDWDNSYYTMSEENNEAIWHFLQMCHEKGWIRQGTDVVPWCPRCGTAISQHELSDGGYADLKHTAVTVLFPLVDEDSALLVWTTTPWTLPANVAAAVNPNFDYVKIKIPPHLTSPRVQREETLINFPPSSREGGGQVGDGIFWLAKDRLSVITDEYEILETVKGSELVGKKYVGPFDELEAVQSLFPERSGAQSKGDPSTSSGHNVVAWDEVSQAEGTGIVHIAPGCGKEDHALGASLGLGLIDPIDEFGVYRSGFGDLTGKFAGDVNGEIAEKLRAKNILFATDTITHSYPICWRCKTSLLFRVSAEWFITAAEIRPRMKQAALAAQWLPEGAGKRMQDWLDNMGDWPISRKRYWGLALPFYPCACGELNVIGSRAELKERAVDPAAVDALPELHRPWIDAIKIKCKKCAETVARIPDVGDCWLDAGIVPFSTLNYFSDRPYWEKWFPAQLVCESVPQVKLWFYTLLFMAVTLENKTPYQNVLTYMTVVDEKGQPMHKSTGNAIWFDDAVEKMGADVMRWMYLSGAIDRNLRFGYSSGDDIRKKILVLWNVYTFFELLQNTPPHLTSPRVQREEKLINFPPSSREGGGQVGDILWHILDRWILARLAEVEIRVTESIAAHLTAPATELLEKFFDDFSTWYLRRSRDRLKAGDQECLAVFQYVLRTLAIVLAPFIPFVTERMYRVGGGEKESVHLEDWPVTPAVPPEQIITTMQSVRDVVAIALEQRAAASMPIRQVLSALTVDKELAPEYLALIKEEVNVKQVIVGKEIKLDLELTDELRVEGATREVLRGVNALRKQAGLKPGEPVTLFVPTGHGLVDQAITLFADELKRKLSVTDIERVAGGGVTAAVKVGGENVEIGISK